MCYSRTKDTGIAFDRIRPAAPEPRWFAVGRRVPDEVPPWGDRKRVQGRVLWDVATLRGPRKPRCLRHANEHPGWVTFETLSLKVTYQRVNALCSTTDPFSGTCNTDQTLTPPPRILEFDVSRTGSDNDCGISSSPTPRVPDSEGLKLCPPGLGEFATLPQRVLITS